MGRLRVRWLNRGEWETLRTEPTVSVREWGTAEAGAGDVGWGVASGALEWPPTEVSGYGFIADGAFGLGSRWRGWVGWLLLWAETGCWMRAWGRGGRGTGGEVRLGSGGNV